MKRVQKPKMVPVILIGRWTPRVLFSLEQRPYRHGPLRRQIGSSQRMLTRTLRHLESAGLITMHATICGRVFLDPTGKDTHRSARRYVPLGETILQERQC